MGTLQCCICGKETKDGSKEADDWSNCESRHEHQSCKQWICQQCSKEGRNFCRGHEITGNAPPSYGKPFIKADYEKEKKKVR